jgi:hypothetical protein
LLKTDDPKLKEQSISETDRTILPICECITKTWKISLTKFEYIEKDWWPNFKKQSISETEDRTILPIQIIDKYIENIITLQILLTHIWSEYEHT